MKYIPTPPYKYIEMIWTYKIEYIMKFRGTKYKVLYERYREDEWYKHEYCKWQPIQQISAHNVLNEYNTIEELIVDIPELILV